MLNNRDMRKYSFLCAMLFSLSASAQVSIDEYRQEVLSRSLEVHGAMIESERAFAQSQVERTEFFPDVSASV